jgi:hypothetical protein
VKRRRKETLFRLYMGLQQIKYRPYYYFFFLPLMLLFAILWRYRDKMLPAKFIPGNIFPLSLKIASIFLLMAFLLLTLAIIKQFGIRASDNIEGGLVTAFNAKDLKMGHPILISIKHKRSSPIFILEFYSSISLARWREEQIHIGECLNIDIISIEYGGKKKNNGNRRIVYATKRGKQENKDLHDDDLDMELKNVD